MLAKLLSVSLVLLLSTPIFGQHHNLQHTQVVARPGQLAGLTTTRQVRQFLQRQGKGYILADATVSDCANYRDCVLPGVAKTWLKADFDGNGRVDIMVVGHPGEHTSQNELVCFLDDGKPKLRVVEVLTQEYGCAVPQLVQAGSRAAMRYTHAVLVGGRFGQNAKLICQVDTLAVRAGQLIEYNHAPKDYQIQRISFRTEACYGRCPIFELQLSRNGTASYYAEEYNDRQGRFAATVAPAQVAELWHLLDYLDFPRLRNFYNVGLTDQATCILTITYANGQVKTIEDYGEEGTLGLRQAYDLLFKLRTTQAWK